MTKETTIHIFPHHPLVFLLYKIRAVNTTSQVINPALTLKFLFALLSRQFWVLHLAFLTFFLVKAIKSLALLIQLLSFSLLSLLLHLLPRSFFILTAFVSFLPALSLPPRSNPS